MGYDLTWLDNADGEGKPGNLLHPLPLMEIIGKGGRDVSRILRTAKT
jgi:hypothetical protein